MPYHYTKLPFEVPTEPMVIARTEEIKKAGGNPFTEYSLPRAVLKFKQGFGRLIRIEDRHRTGRHLRRKDKNHALREEFSGECEVNVL